MNGERADRVRVEHELVAHVVSDTNPEEEKLELREQAVNALRAVLDAGVPTDEEAVLYDRLLGIVNEVELRQTPALLAHVVRFIQTRSEWEQHAYCRRLPGHGVSGCPRFTARDDGAVAARRDPEGRTV